MAIERVSRCPSRRPMPRAHNFGEVNLGCTEQLAMLEAERCLQCKNPSASTAARSGSTSRASSTSSRDGDMPGRRRVAPRRQRAAVRDRPGLPAGDPVRGRLPPRQEGRLRSRSATSSATWPTGRSSTPTAMTHVDATPRPGKTVAIVGSGPAGLTAAGELAKRGYDVTDVRGLPRRRRRPRSTGSPSSACRRTSSTRGRPAGRRGRQDRGERDHRQDLHARPSCARSSTPCSSPSVPGCRCS